MAAVYDLPNHPRHANSRSVSWRVLFTRTEPPRFLQDQSCSENYAPSRHLPKASSPLLSPLTHSAPASSYTPLPSFSLVFSPPLLLSFLFFLPLFNFFLSSSIFSSVSLHSFSFLHFPSFYYFPYHLFPSLFLPYYLTSFSLLLLLLPFFLSPSLRLVTPSPSQFLHLSSPYFIFLCFDNLLVRV